MNEEVVDLGHEVIDAAIIVVPNPRKKVIDGFLQERFEVRSKASSLPTNRPQGVRIGIERMIEDAQKIHQERSVLQETLATATQSRCER